MRWGKLPAAAANAPGGGLLGGFAERRTGKRGQRICNSRRRQPALRQRLQVRSQVLTDRGILQSWVLGSCIDSDCATPSLDSVARAARFILAKGNAK
ncbi:MAG TPA: hypothetical protein VME45_02445 [Stellaceae bacterium]|nr:hypothetical protein [Stellaceae bacterium]